MLHRSHGSAHCGALRLHPKRYPQAHSTSPFPLRSFPMLQVVVLTAEQPVRAHLLLDLVVVPRRPAETHLARTMAVVTEAHLGLRTHALSTSGSPVQPSVDSPQLIHGCPPFRGSQVSPMHSPIDPAQFDPQVPHPPCRHIPLHRAHRNARRPHQLEINGTACFSPVFPGYSA